MRVIKKEIKQNSLIHQKIRDASFVSIESQDTEKFKYNLGLKVSKYFSDKFIASKQKWNKIIQKLQLWGKEVDFISLKKDLSIWLIEAAIEGFIINFIVWALLGLSFKIVTILAWGFAVKQSLSIYERIKKDGPTTTILKQNK